MRDRGSSWGTEGAGGGGAGGILKEPGGGQVGYWGRGGGGRWDTEGAGGGGGGY